MIKQRFSFLRRGRWGRALLLGGIDGYRRWLSGRGPFARVRCTFEATESCSAYGRRIASELTQSGDTVRALGLIRARLGRCGAAAVFRVDGNLGDLGDLAGLVWGPVYDESPEAIDTALAQARELPQTRLAILRARAAIADACAAPTELAQCRAYATQQARLLPRALVADAHIAVRTHLAWKRTRAKYLRWRLALGCTPLSGLLLAWAVLGPGVVSTLIASTSALAACGLLFTMLRAHLREGARAERLLAARAFIAQSDELSKSPLL